MWPLYFPDSELKYYLSLQRRTYWEMLSSYTGYAQLIRAKFVLPDFQVKCYFLHIVLEYESYFCGIQCWF